MSSPTIAREHIDLDAQKVIRHLVRNGYQAYLVGGCVRDLLLARTPKDFDVATDATPAEIRDLFRNCRIIGRRFRLAHIVFGRKIIETATFRANPRPPTAESGLPGEARPEGDDDEATEGPGGATPAGDSDVYLYRDNVFGTAEEDARRRDFTINGLFYDLESGRVIDYVGGLDDLGQRHLRTIGDPNLRFREDPVRMLRAVKFAARLGFDIEDETYRAMISHHAEIQKSPAPRVLEEIYRLLRGAAASESMVLLRETGLLSLLLPEVADMLRLQPMALDPYLMLLDERVQVGDSPSNAALLAILCAPALSALFDDATAPRDVLGRIDAIISPLCIRLRVARRDVERLRQTLIAQRRIAQARKRGGRLPAGLLSRDYGNESLGLHALFYRAGRIAAGASLEQSAQEVQTWPLPQPLWLGDDEVASASHGRPSSSESGRSRRREGRGGRDEAGDEPREPSREEDSGDSGPSHDSAHGDEDAAIAAYTAALQRPVGDDSDYDD
ncbi:MAG TPA: polynucleotide adenylyltransferase PcnB [Pseudomonadota bacterium]|nr:polynucleotide adenylyltransferase PcnB [Pseudomonadota bacterium]